MKIGGGRRSKEELQGVRSLEEVFEGRSGGDPKVQKSQCPQVEYGHLKVSFEQQQELDSKEGPTSCINNEENFVIF